MAYRTVETPEEQKATTKFRKKGEVWPEIGSVYKGFYLKTEVAQNPEYGFDYYFQEKDNEVYRITLKGQIHKDLEKCNLQEGEFVVITKKGEKDIGKENPMPLYKIEVDPPGSPKFVKAAAKPAAAADGW